MESVSCILGAVTPRRPYIVWLGTCTSITLHPDYHALLR